MGLVLLLPLISAELVLSTAVIGSRRASRGLRWVGVALILIALLQLAAAIWGHDWVLSLHVASSYDPLGDGFDVLFKTIGLLAALALSGIALSAYLSIAIAIARTGGVSYIDGKASLPAGDAAETGSVPER